MVSTGAALLYGPGQDDKIETIDIDGPAAGEVLIQMKATGLCHSDEHARTGDMPMPHYPIICGHEGAGEVLEVGEGVTNLAPGDHVVFSFVPACGRCPSCASGHSNLCDNGAALLVGAQMDGTTRHHARGQDIWTMVCLGTFAHHTVVNEMSCVKVEADIPLELACLLGCGVPTGWGSSVHAAGVEPGDNVCVIGVGGIGAAAVRYGVFIGQGHVAGRVAGLSAIEQGVELAVAFGQRQLLLHQLFNLFFHNLLVKKLAAGDAVNLRAKSRDAVFVIVLHARLTGHGGTDQVVAQHQVGRREQVTDCHSGHCRTHERSHPRANREVPDLVTPGDDDCMRFLASAEYR